MPALHWLLLLLLVTSRLIPVARPLALSTESTRGLKIAHLNIRSLANKIDSLRLKGINNKTIDVLTLSEI